MHFNLDTVIGGLCLGHLGPTCGHFGLQCFFVLELHHGKFVSALLLYCSCRAKSGGTRNVAICCLKLFLELMR